MESPSDNRARNALLFAAMPAIGGALIAKGWFGAHLDTWFAVLVSVAGAPVAGALIGRDRADKVFSSIAAVIGALGIVMAAVWYIEARHTMVTLELLVPILLGGLPGLAAFYAFRQLEPRPLARVIVAFGASVITVALVAVL